MTISQEDARRAIELLTRAHDRLCGCSDEAPLLLEGETAEFLYDDDGYARFEERDDDPSPMCRCEECPMGGPYTCVSED